MFEKIFKSLCKIAEIQRSYVSKGFIMVETILSLIIFNMVITYTLLIVPVIKKQVDLYFLEIQFYKLKRKVLSKIKKKIKEKKNSVITLEKLKKLEKSVQKTIGFHQDKFVFKINAQERSLVEYAKQGKDWQKLREDVVIGVLSLKKDYIQRQKLQNSSTPKKFIKEFTIGKIFKKI